jgi:hypothetical protein
MADRAVGNIFKWWVGEVENINDPDRAGRIQVRIIGQHDDVTRIPTSSLPWAQVLQPVTSAAAGGIGTAPVGLVPGSRVVGFWADGLDAQFPVVMGSIARAGRPTTNGQTVNGAPAIDPTGAGVPPGIVGNARNPIRDLTADAHNPLTVDERNTTQGTIMTEAVVANMINPNLPTIASLDRDDTNSVIDQIKAVDPLGQLASLPCLNFGFITVNSILSFLAGVVRGILTVAAAAIRNAILRLAQRIGIFKVMAILNFAINTANDIQNLIRALNLKICGVNLFNQGLFKDFEFLMADVIGGLNNTLNAITGGLDKFINFSTGGLLTNAPALSPAQQMAVNALVGSWQPRPQSRVATPTSARPLPAYIRDEPPIGWMMQYYSYDEDPFPGYIQWTDPNNQLDPIYTHRAGLPNYINAEQHNRFATEDHFFERFAPVFASEVLPGYNEMSILFQSASNFSSNFGNQQLLGYGSNPIQAATAVITTIATLVQTAFTAVVAVRGVTSLATAPTDIAYFTVKQALLARQEIAMRAGLLATAAARIAS